MYHEVQYFRKKWIFLLALFICIPLLGLMVYGLVSQVYFDVPFGSHPISDTGIWILSAFVIAITIGIPLLIYISKLVIKIKNDKFYFRYFPFHFSCKKINLSEIEKYEIKQFSPINDYGGWGIRKSMLRKETAYIVSGTKGILFSYKSGKKVLVGTQKPEELLEVLKKIKF